MNPLTIPSASVPGTARHLTDDQFTDLLLGAASTEVAAHLAACPGCEQEVARVSGAIGRFEQQSRLWAERRAWSTPVHSPVQMPLAARFWAVLHLPAASAAWYAAAAGVVFALGFGLTHRATPAPSSMAAATQASSASAKAISEVTPSKLKEDNALLSAIDGELSADATPPAAMYGLYASIGIPHHTRTRSAKGFAN